MAQSLLDSCEHGIYRQQKGCCGIVKQRTTLNNKEQISMKKILSLTGIIALAALVSSSAFAGNTGTDNSTNTTTSISASLPGDQAGLKAAEDSNSFDLGYSNSGGSRNGGSYYGSGGNRNGGNYNGRGWNGGRRCW